MTERRCASCGALLGADAEWCGQCYARVEPAATERVAPSQEAAPETSDPAPQVLRTPPDAVVTPLRPRGRPASVEGTGVRSRGEDVVWECPTCGEEAPIDVEICPVCGTPFSQLLQGSEEGARADPDAAARASLFFPGAGHYVAGRRAEGFARGVVFAFALATGLFALSTVLRGGTAVFGALAFVALGGAAALYGLSAVDARRAATGSDPVVSTRALLYGGVGLMLLTLGLLTVAMLSASRGG